MPSLIILGTNSYNSLTELEAYMLTRLNSAAWDNATVATREKAAISATNEMDEQDIIGAKYVSTQALEFPRSFDAGGILSVAVKKAHREWTLEMLEEDYTLTQNLENGLTLKQVDGTSESYGGNRAKVSINEPTRKSLRYIRQYLYAPTASIR